MNAIEKQYEAIRATKEQIANTESPKRKYQLQKHLNKLYKELNTYKALRQAQ